MGSQRGRGEQLGARRMLAGLLVAGLSVPLVAVAASACGAVPPWAWALGAAAALGCLRPVARALPESVDSASESRCIFAVLWLLVALAANVQLVRLGAFMIDPGARRFSVLPFDPFHARHSCLTCYLRGAELALEGEENIYLDEHYGGPGDRGDGFRQDHYSYPPPFLLLPLIELGLGRDFTFHRKLWFVGQALLYGAAVLAVARWIGDRDLRTTLLLAPVLAAALPVAMTLQFANFQMAALGISLLGMLLLQTGRRVPGGALVAFAALTKIFPGVLAAWLLFRRRWRDAGWVLGWSVVFVSFTFLLLGSAPFTAFFQYQLPRVADGTAFPWLSSRESGAMIASNHSISGLVWKLWYLGVPGMGRSLAGAVGVGFQLFVLGLAWFTARRPGLGDSPADRRATAATWLALFNLAALSSPFAPVVYGVIGTLWLLVMLGPELRGDRRAQLAWILAFTCLALFLPSGGMRLPPIWARMALSSVGQFVGVALNLWVLLRRTTR